MRKRHPLFALALCLLFSWTVQADCVLNNADNPAGGRTPTGTFTFGQSFRPCQTGFIQSIKVNTGGGDLRLYLVAGNEDAVNLATPLQTFTSIPMGDVTLTLNTTFPVTAGQLYSFAIGNTDGILFDNSPNNNAPVDGTAGAPQGIQAFNINGVSINTPNSDLFFQINIATRDPFAPSIPTMSQWGIMIFALLLLNMGVLLLLKKEKMRRHYH